MAGVSTETSALTSMPPPAAGPLALVGGAEWSEGCTFDADLLAASGQNRVLVVPTAAAYEHPARAVATASEWFAALGGEVEGLMVLGRGDAENPEHAGVVRRARFIYFGGGSPLHLRSVLKDSAVWAAVVDAWHGGAVLAGSSAGAMVLGDSMVDPRGGALTLGLGLVPRLAILPHADTWSPEKSHRTVELATGHLRIAAIDERSALIHMPGRGWEVAGAGGVTVYVDGRPAPLGILGS